MTRITLLCRFAPLFSIYIGVHKEEQLCTGDPEDVESSAAIKLAGRVLKRESRSDPARKRAWRGREVKQSVRV